MSPPTGAGFPNSPLEVPTMGRKPANASKTESPAKVSLKAKLLAMGFTDVENARPRKSFKTKNKNLVAQQIWDELLPVLAAVIPYSPGDLNSPEQDKTLKSTEKLKSNWNR